jgi:hypothetical protein
VDGARKDLLEIVTHSQRGSIIDLYSSMPWASLCEEVGKLRIERQGAKRMSKPSATSSCDGIATSDNDGESSDSGEEGASADASAGAVKALLGDPLTSVRTSTPMGVAEAGEETGEQMVEAPGIERDRCS